jgi:hypothetical protein
MSSGSQSRGAYLNANQRKLELENDESICQGSVTSQSVKCKGCLTRVKLHIEDNKPYLLGNWKKHKSKCPQITGKVTIRKGFCSRKGGGRGGAFADVLPKFPGNFAAPLEGLGVYSEEQGSSGLSNNPPVNEVKVNKILVIVQDVFYHVKKLGPSASTNTSTGISKIRIAATEKTATQALSGHIATPTTPSCRPYT